MTHLNSQLNPDITSQNIIDDSKLDDLKSVDTDALTSIPQDSEKPSNQVDSKTNRTSRTSRTSRTVQASSNLYKTTHGWQMLIALPQVDPQSIELETVGHKLHLKAYTQDQTIRYVRQVTFPNHVGWGELTASWHHGILKVELGRADVQTQKLTFKLLTRSIKTDIVLKRLFTLIKVEFHI